MTVSHDQSGLALIQAEMARQHSDALDSYAAALDLASDIAVRIRRSNRLVLIGMGGSHCVNRMAEPIYRSLGIDVTAHVASELLHTPLANFPRTSLLVSQSGGSGEILRYLDDAAQAGEDRFGLTLEGGSPMAGRIPCLVGKGGPEKAFAATRSLMITVAQHAAIAAALGCDMGPALESLRNPTVIETGQALDRLANKEVFVISGRGSFQGLAEAGSLGLMELARVPALALEGGQFRHGPMEILTEKTGIIVLRGPGWTADLASSLVRLCAEAGSSPVVFEASGNPELAHALTVTCPRLDGFAALFTLLPPLQRLVLAIARAKVSRVGEPIRSTKVTGME